MQGPASGLFKTEKMQGIIKFIKEAYKELKKVKWPTKKQTIKYAKTVIVMSLLVAIFLGTLDLIFNQIIANLL